MVVSWADSHPAADGILADATPEELLRGQEAGVKLDIPRSDTCDAFLLQAFHEAVSSMQ